MTCREFADFLSDYFSGELDLARREVFDRHLSVCSDCRNYLSTYRTTVKLTQTAFVDDQIPADVPPQLLRAILQARQSGGESA